MGTLIESASLLIGDIEDNLIVDSSEIDFSNFVEIDTSEDERAAMSSLRAYETKIKSIPLLEKSVLTELAKQGTVEARNKIVEHNLRLVIHMAHKFKHSVPMEEKIGWGNIGLITAATKYDPYKINKETGEPYNFSTYATWWIRQTLERECMNTESTIRIPIHAHKANNRVFRVKRTMEQQYPEIKNPSKEQLFAFVEEYNAKLDPDDTKNSLKLEDTDFNYEFVPVTLLDCDMGVATDYSNMFDEETYISLVPSETGCPFEDAYTEELFTALDTSMHYLSERQKHVFTQRTGFNPNEDTITLEDVGKEIGVTRERVRQIQKEATTRLKHEIQKYV